MTTTTRPPITEKAFQAQIIELAGYTEHPFDILEQEKAGAQRQLPPARPSTLEVPDMAERTCSIPGCSNPARSRGWCNVHVSRWRRHGDPLAGGPARTRPMVERFCEKVLKPVDPGDCWLWVGGLDTLGYGQIKDPTGKHQRAHRVSYVLHVGPIPEGLVLDHLCRNSRCVNPTHLEPVTQVENMRRAGLYAMGTHCRNGHLRTPRNTISKGRCRICVIIQTRALKNKRAAA